MISVLTLNSQSSIHFGLEACDANINSGAGTDYSEFTPEIVNDSTCGILEVEGGHLYRQIPFLNRHSCTPGVNGSVAMCVSSEPSCTYNGGSMQSIIIDIIVTPGSDGTANLSALEFYERAPEEFTWIDGASGPNNYPTLFGVRVLKGDSVIFVADSNSTEPDWNLNTFSFSGQPAFTVTTATVFTIELLGYCPIGNGATVSAWDVDEIVIKSDCCPELDGGQLEGGPFEFCVGDSIPDMVSGIALTGNIGTGSQWVITDDSLNILGLPASPELVNFDVAGSGVCLIWHVSYDDSLGGLEVGNNVATDLDGCHAISNAITVERNQPVGGVLTGGPFEFCVGDGEPDHVSGIMLSDSAGPQSQWVVTDTAGLILGVPSSPEDVNFDSTGAGVCLIWHLSYSDSLAGLELGENAADLQGCFSLSNPIVVIRTQPSGGTLAGGPFEFCVGDGMPDYVSGITLTGNSGPNNTWVITDTIGNILGLPPAPDSVDFDQTGQGVCLIWNISYEDGLSGLEVDQNVDSLEGCFSLSNAITVNRNQPSGGVLNAGPFSFCVGDGEPDYVTGLVANGSTGPNTAWIVTDTAGLILALPTIPDSVDFDLAEVGTCLIWHIDYLDGLTGLAIGNNAYSDLAGCFGLSDSVVVYRSQPEAGELTGGPFDFCTGDSIPDRALGIELTGFSGPNGQWVITDILRNILALPSSPEAFDFDTTGPGVGQIWYLSYDNGLVGLAVGGNLNELEGCSSLSNPLMVLKSEPVGGTITGGPFEFCVGDSTPDFVSGIDLMGNLGANSQWVVTDTAGTILGLPGMPEDVDFDVAPPGTCLIWHLSYADTLEGLNMGGSVDSLIGCFGFSNAIAVVRIAPEICDTSIANVPNVMIYPNPARDFVWVGNNSSVKSESTIQLFSSTGQLLRSVRADLSGGHVPIDLAGLQDGQFYVRVVSGRHVRVTSFVVAR